MSKENKINKSYVEGCEDVFNLLKKGILDLIKYYVTINQLNNLKFADAVGDLFAAMKEDIADMKAGTKKETTQNEVIERFIKQLNDELHDAFSKFIQ